MTTFYSWFDRPAFLPDFKEQGYAVVEPHGPWIIVSKSDLADAEIIGTAAEWRARFEPMFGFLDGRKVPWPPCNPLSVLIVARACKRASVDDPKEYAHFENVEERALDAIRTGRKGLTALN